MYLCSRFTDRYNLRKHDHVASANHSRAEHQSEDWLFPGSLTIQPCGEVLLLENYIRAHSVSPLPSHVVELFFENPLWSPKHNV